MRTVCALGLALGAMAFCGPASAQSPPINLRLGGWDAVMSFTVNGKPQVTKLKTCLTKEDLDSLRTFEKDEDCKYRWTSRTAARLTGTTRCTVNGVVREGEIDVQIANPETYQVSGGMRLGGKADAASQFEMKGRWASPSCKGYDD